ncbi:MAG TPA: FAD-binding oxidoreductase [Ktedonobacterales bacterium]|nr:FAD-binding oxidoreductase [Ktedonobacterales bacterium]
MITLLDSFLDRITMYRLVLYALLWMLGIATILSFLGLLPFTPLALLLSAAFLVLICWAANTMLARIFNVPANVESAFITGLILALIIDPARAPDDLQFLGWAAILAMSSKYILALNKKHIFNPAAIAVVVTSFVLHESASWWVGSASMLPAVVLGGVLVVHKLRHEDMALCFLAAALVTLCVVCLIQGLILTRELRHLFVDSPVFFVAAIMLTEPLTMPPTRGLRRIYSILVGFLIVPQIHIAMLYSTPELALVVGNAYSYLVSPKLKVALKLKRKARMSADIVDFAFAPSRRLRFTPGQYLELTLPHKHSDARGNRRYFTIASSPTEDSVHLGVRFYPEGSSFKAAMYALDGRIKVLGGQFAGDFTLPANRAQKLAFIAGGIGITPYRSMLKYLLDTKQCRDIVLLYAARTTDDIVYRDVLSEAQSKLGIKIAFTLTDTAAIPRNWSDGKGRIDAQMIQQVMPDFKERTFYLSGPPDMVRAHERVLRHMGVHGGQIKKDLFPGLV